MTVIKQRAAGVLMHLSSLHGDYSVGSFGKEAFEFIDFLANAGFSYWQVLPFNIPDDCDSPYKSVSAFAGNPYFIDLPTLSKEGLITSLELANAQQQTPYLVESRRLAESRELLLRKAASRATNRDEIYCFITEHPFLDEACRFFALDKANCYLPWQLWKTDRYDDRDYFYHAFTQYHFHNQWQAVKSYANQKNISIIGDLPIYVGLHSADVYFHPDQFELDERGYPTGIAGCPPDYFSADGQMWGNPLYRWNVMKKDGFHWWRARMEHMLSLFDGVRIDHFRGIESYWRIPATAETAREGKWCKGPGMAFVRAMKAVAGDQMIIAEDLGDIPPAVQQLLEKSGFPGMRVFQFAFLGDQNSPHLPHNYPSNCLAYTGTHDNNTLLGYVWEQDADTRRQMLEYCGYTDADWNNGYDAIIRTMMLSHAGLVILPIQDLLRFGADTRMNTPGRAVGNWRYRITREQFEGLDVAKYRKLNELYGRLSRSR